MAIVFRMPRQIARKTVGDERRLIEQGYPVRQNRPEQVSDEGIMGAGQGGARDGPPAAAGFASGFFPGAGHESGEHSAWSASFDRRSQAGAGLFDDGQARVVTGDLTREGAAGDRGRRGEDDDGLSDAWPHLSRRCRLFRRPPGMAGQRLDEGDMNTQHPAVGSRMGQPLPLKSTQCDGGRSVAGQNHQPTTGGEQPLHAGTGERMHFLAIALAIGLMAVVAEIQERPIGQTTPQGCEHRQSP